MDVMESLNEWVEFWNTYNVDQVDRLFLNDDRLTYFSSEKEGVLVGLEAVREHHRGFGFVEGGKESRNRLWLDYVRQTELGATAVVTAIWYFQKPGGAVQRGPVTIVYVMEGEAWRIAHMNFSSYPSGE